MPLVVPHLKTITLGGAVTGLGIESTSLRNGMPHESVTEMQILTGDGRVVTATADIEYRDLYYGFPNSYGTLGYSLALTIELRHARLPRRSRLHCHRRSRPGFPQRKPMTPALLPAVLRACARGLYAAEAAIDWLAAVTALTPGKLPSSSGEQKMLRLAGSIVGQSPVTLGDAITALDDRNIQILLRASSTPPVSASSRQPRDLTESSENDR